MSWSFNVTGNTAQEAFDKFQEELWKNGANVPFGMGDNINKAACALGDIAARDETHKPPGGVTRRVCVASSGHFDIEGVGNVSVTLHVLPPETPEDE